MAEDKRVCIIYWGLLRGFVKEYTFNNHKQKLYDCLSDNNIAFDVYVSTNDIEYNEEAIYRIPNLKIIKKMKSNILHKQ